MKGAGVDLCIFGFFNREKQQEWETHETVLYLGEAGAFGAFERQKLPNRLPFVGMRFSRGFLLVPERFQGLRREGLRREGLRRVAARCER